MFYQNMFEAQRSNGASASNGSSNRRPTGHEDKYSNQNKDSRPANPATPALSVFDPYGFSSYAGSFTGFNSNFMNPSPTASAMNNLFGSNLALSQFVAPGSNYMDHPPTGFNALHSHSLMANRPYPAPIYPDSRTISNFSNNKNSSGSQPQNGERTNGEISFSEQLKRLQKSLQSKPIDSSVKCECDRGKCLLHQSSSSRQFSEHKLKQHTHHREESKLRDIKKEFDCDSNPIELAHPHATNGLNTATKDNQQNNGNVEPKAERSEQCSQDASRIDKSMDDVAKDKLAKKIDKRKLKSSSDSLVKKAKNCNTPDMNNKLKSMFDKKRFITNKSLGETLLHRSARNNKLDIVKYCLEETDFRDVNVRDNAGYTPLHECSSRGHIQVAKLLLEYSADVNASATGGIRPLHDAIENDHIEIARLLLSYGADPYIATYSGSLPLQLSCSKAMTTFLTQFYKDISIEDSCAQEKRLLWKFSNDMIDHNIFSDLPSEDEEDEGVQDFVIEVSEKCFVPSYHLNDQADTHFYLLNDVLEALELSESQFLARYEGRVTITQMESKQFNKSALSDQLEQRFKRLKHLNSANISVIAKDELMDKILGIRTTVIQQH